MRRRVPDSFGVVAAGSGPAPPLHHQKRAGATPSLTRPGNTQNPKRGTPGSKPENDGQHRPSEGPARAVGGNHPDCESWSLHANQYTLTKKCSPLGQMNVPGGGCPSQKTELGEEGSTWGIGSGNRGWKNGGAKGSNGSPLAPDLPPSVKTEGQMVHHWLQIPLQFQAEGHMVTNGSKSPPVD